MNLLKAFIITFYFISFNAFSLETDNFLTWGRELQDSSNDINKYINKKAIDTLESLNLKRRSFTCEQVRNKVIMSFRGFITHPMEHWIESTLGSKKVFPSEQDYSDVDYFMMSIYGTPKFDVSKYFSLSRNININGIYLGTDKLSHWMSTGERYYQVYKRHIKKGRSEEVAFQKAINYGVFLDRFILGGVSSGVFSFGDLEANFQGLLLNRQFCRVSKDSRYLKYENGRWVLQRKIDVRDYVNPNFDETFNPSIFSALKWDKVKENFKKENCQKIQNQVYKSRFDYYNKILKPSFSFKYIEELKKQNIRLPKNRERNYTTICL